MVDDDTAEINSKDNIFVGKIIDSNLRRVTQYNTGTTWRIQPHSHGTSPY